MSPCRECAADRPGELLDELRELRLACVEGRRHDDGVATGAADVARAGIDDEPVLERAAPDRLAQGPLGRERLARALRDRKSTRLNSSHVEISYAVFCLKKKKISTIVVS